MKALVQRVSRSEVSVDGEVIAAISGGLLVMLCAEKGDSTGDLEYLAGKVTNLRIFSDSEGKMNLSLLETGGEALVISQFTLSARTRRGNRPSFSNAETPSKAKEMYEQFIAALERTGIKVSSGEFGANMEVEISNNGPVTIMIDSREEKA